MTTVPLNSPVRSAPPRRPGGRARPVSNLTPGAGLALGLSVTWFSLLVLIPLAALVFVAAGGGWDAYVRTSDQPPDRSPRSS